MSERWQRMWAIYHAAAGQSDDEREAFVAAECGEDDALAREVLAMLARRPPKGFMENGPSLDEDDPLVGQQLDRYVIQDVIGEGGMGKVYLAHETGVLDRPVALKVVRRGIDTERVVRRFRAEQETLARLQHPAIAAVYHAGVTADGRPWFAMEYVDGVSITRYCREDAASLDQRINLILQVCEAVQHTHQKGVIHRDLKPSNILVQRDSNAIKLIDFGIARAIQTDSDASRVTRQGQVMGTPEYMSPEQATDAGDVDTRSDVYSLGVVLYELLTGDRPFGDLKGTALNDALRTQDPVTPSQRLAAGNRDAAGVGIDDPAQWRRRLKGDLDWVVMKALARNRDDRYASVAAFAADIRNALAHRPVAARPRGRAYLLGRFVRRHPLGVTATTAASFALVVLSVSLWMRGNELSAALTVAMQQRERAEQIAEFMTETFTAADPYEHGKMETTARDLLASGRERAETLDTDPVVRSVLLTTIANTWRRLGELDESQSAAEAALTAVEHLETQPALEARAEALTSLATVSREQARFELVVDYGQRALDLRRRLFGDTSSEVSAMMATLGYGWLQLGDYEKAEPLLTAAVQLREQHPDADSLPPHFYLASLYSTQGRYTEAEPLYLETLAHAVRLYGPDHPETAAYQGNLAILYYRTGQYEEAARRYEAALAIHRAKLDDNHPNVLTLMNNLGALYNRMEDYERAKPLMEHVVAGRRESLGAEHMEVGVTIYHLANALTGLGELDAAEGHYRQALSIIGAAAGENDRRVGVVLNGMTRMLLKAHRNDEAVASARQAVRINESGWPAGHRTTAASHLYLGQALLATGALEEAGREAATALASLDDDVGGQLEAAQARGLMGLIALQQGDTEAAWPLLEQALARIAELRGEDHPSAEPLRVALARAVD